ncbi:MAG: radical SAM protein [Candidatus Thorarchaeota archaeon]|nr:radical SAM protein [Candidatus Thorarchaeota archaeon]
MIVDGYVDEPTCLGVPPYMSTYPRYIAGAIWTCSPHTEVVYQTIDQVRISFDSARRLWSSADMVILIAGMIVPGKYLGGTPISVNEARTLFSDPRLESVPKLLVGPWARFGCGVEGGRVALSADTLSPPFDYIVKGDAEIVLSESLRSGSALDSLDLSVTRSSPSEVETFAVKGSAIVKQAPGFHRGHVICEIETYRGCPRFLTGGCSFCTEPLYGSPQQRQINCIVEEIEALYASGIRAFRIGRQADLFTYGSKQMGDEEYPRPEPAVIEELFSKTRRVAPDLSVLHIDNVNPGTIARHPEESREVAKAIMRYHTPGDVAALGVESADPEVVRRNNLKATPEEALEAIALLNEVGSTRPGRGLPHLLPGVNFVYGLPGESRATADHNMVFLTEVLRRGLLLRRINIRQVIGFPQTRVASEKVRGLKHNEFFRHKEEVRRMIDIPMLRRVAPLGTVIRSVFAEQQEGNNYLLRPLASYPLLCHMPMGSGTIDTMDVFVVDHGPRSVTVLPYPFDIKTATMSQLEMIPGIGAKRAARIKSHSPATITELERLIECKVPDWLSESLVFGS